jgi:hypothetical protein
MRAVSLGALRIISQLPLLAGLPGGWTYIFPYYGMGGPTSQPVLDPNTPRLVGESPLSCWVAKDIIQLKFPFLGFVFQTIQKPDLHNWFGCKAHKGYARGVNATEQIRVWPHSDSKR